MRQQLRNLTRRLSRQASENVLQISIRIMPIEPCRLDQTHDRSRTFSAAQRARENPVLASSAHRRIQGNALNCMLVSPKNRHASFVICSGLVDVQNVAPGS